MALRQIMTPNGPLLLSDEDAAAYGFAPPEPPVNFGAPALPPPPEEPVPDVAFNPPPPVPDALSGAGAVMPGMAPQLTPGLAASGLVPSGGVEQAGSPPPIAQETAPRAPQGQFPGDDVAAGSPPPEQQAAAPRAPVDLRATSWSDIAERQQSDIDAEAAATTQLGESEAQALAAKADAMAARDAALAQRQQEAEAAAKLEQAEIAKRAQAWENKQAEWMNAKVVRRGFNAAEIIGAVIAGFGSAMKGQGDRNPALDMAMAKIQTNVDDQIRERDEMGRHVSALKGSVDYAREIAKDGNAARMAAIGMDADRMGREIETVAAKMAPGVKRDEVALLATGLRQKGTAFLVASKQQDDSIRQAEAARAQQERESRRAAGIQYARIAEDKRQSDRAFIAGEGDKAFARTATVIGLGNEAAKAAAAGQAAKATAAATAAKDTTERGIIDPILREGAKTRQLLNRDGSPMTAPTVDEAKEARLMMAMATDSLNASREIRKIIREGGGSSETLKGKDWQRIQSLKATILDNNRLMSKGGALDKGSVEQGEKKLGATDLTSFIHDAAPGLEQLERSITDGVNLKLKALTWDPEPGTRWEVPDLTDVPDAPRDKDFDALIQSSTNAPAASWADLDTDKGKRRVEAGRGRALTDEQELGLRDLAKRAETDPAAMTKLVAAAQKSDNPAARTAAAQKVIALAAAGNKYAALALSDVKAKMRGQRAQ